MPSYASAEVPEYLARLTPEQRVIITRLRRVVRRAAPGLAETILWGSLSYHRPSFGGRISGAVCLLTPRQDCVHVGFIHGAALRDPAHLLRGTGKSKRIVVVRSVRDIDTQALVDLIAAANRHDPRQKKA